MTWYAPRSEEKTMINSSRLSLLHVRGCHVKRKLWGTMLRLAEKEGEGRQRKPCGYKEVGSRWLPGWMWTLMMISACPPLPSLKMVGRPILTFLGPCFHTSGVERPSAQCTDTEIKLKVQIGREICGACKKQRQTVRITKAWSVLGDISSHITRH